jgi:hypothetical protein
MGFGPASHPAAPSTALGHLKGQDGCVFSPSQYMEAWAGIQLDIGTIKDWALHVLNTWAGQWMKGH